MEMLSNTIKTSTVRDIRDSKQGVYTHEEWGAYPATGTNSMQFTPLPGRQGEHNPKTSGGAGHVWNLSPEG